LTSDTGFAYSSPNGAIVAIKMKQDGEKKFREMILLICARSEGDKKFGATKLNKLLFHSDFSAYLTFRKAITGEKYFKLKNGPAPQRLVPITLKMVEAEELAYKEVNYFGRKQKKPIALRQPDLSLFTAQEIDLIHGKISKYWNLSASEISEQSHGFLGWLVCKEREIIPYSTALVGTRKPSPEEQAYGLELEPIALGCLARGNA
jgi:hypothetical protein